MSRKFISYAQYGKIKIFFFLFFLAVGQAGMVLTHPTNLTVSSKSDFLRIDQIYLLHTNEVLRRIVG